MPASPLCRNGAATGVLCMSFRSVLQEYTVTRCWIFAFPARRLFNQSRFIDPFWSIIQDHEMLLVQEITCHTRNLQYLDYRLAWNQLYVWFMHILTLQGLFPGQTGVVDKHVPIVKSSSLAKISNKCNKIH